MRRQNIRVDKDKDIDIRTVDGFQGQEREVIVFSAVRANDDGHGWKQVGFLDDPHRMNVLLTRARRGLVVVGNRDTLASDELWKSWIDYAGRYQLIEDTGDNDDRSVLGVVIWKLCGWFAGRPTSTPV